MGVRTAGGLFTLGETTDARNTLDLETVHCPTCMAQPEYCPGHADDGEFPGTVVPQSHLGLRMSGKGGVGRFSGDPVTRWSDDGERVILLNPFSYTDKRFNVWEAPKGLILDGASIPRPFWTLVGSPYRGKYRYAAIIHDWHCMDRSEPWESVHRMLYDASLCGGCAATHAKLLFYAVYHFGPRWGGDERMSNGCGGVTSSDVALIRRFVEEDDPSLRQLVATKPRDLGVVRRFGRRGLGTGIGPVLSPMEEGE